MPQRPRSLQPYSSSDAYFGAQLRAWRTRAGLSQAGLGRLVHVSGDLIGKIEKAERRAHQQLIADLDTALAAGGALTGCAPAPEELPPHANVDAPGTECTHPVARRSRLVVVSVLEEAITAMYRVRVKPAVGETGAIDGQTTVSRLWRSYQAARFVDSVLAAAVVIPGLEQAVREGPRGEESRTSLRALALAYHAAAATATKLGATDLAWICADRGLNAAMASEDAAAVASLMRSVAYVLQSTNRYVEATDVAEAAVHAAAADLPAGPLRWSLIGSLHLAAAMASARATDSERARSHLSEAARLAELVGHDANYAWTAFGPTNVSVHELSVQVELGDLAASVVAVPLARVCRLPRERRIRHHLEVARVWSATGRNDEAAGLVLAAHREAPDQVRHHALARVLVAGWLHHPVAKRSDVRDLIRDLILG